MSKEYFCFTFEPDGAGLRRCNNLVFGDIFDIYEPADPAEMSVDKLQESAISYLNGLEETDEAYVDVFGIIHQVVGEKNNLFCYCFCLEDGDWDEVIGTLGQILAADDEQWNLDTDYIYQGIEEMYNFFLPYAFSECYEGMECHLSDE